MLDVKGSLPFHSFDRCGEIGSFRTDFRGQPALYGASKTCSSPSLCSVGGVA